VISSWRYLLIPREFLIVRIVSHLEIIWLTLIIVVILIRFVTSLVMKLHTKGRWYWIYVRLRCRELPNGWLDIVHGGLHCTPITIEILALHVKISRIFYCISRKRLSTFNLMERRQRVLKSQCFFRNLNLFQSLWVWTFKLLNVSDNFNLITFFEVSKVFL